MTTTTAMRIIILVITVVFIVFLIYFSSPFQENQSLIDTSSPSLIPQVPFISPRTLTPQEQAVLNVPLHSASETEKTKHTQAVAELAKTALALDITSCVPNPTVYNVPLNSSFTIINNDAIPHTLRYMSSQIMVPARNSIIVKTSKLFTVSGDYGYGCDNPFAKHGVLVVR